MLLPSVRGYAAHRRNARRSASTYDFLQEHVGPHLQLAPQAQPAAGLFALAFWQPQVQAAPGHDSQLQVFDWFDILKLLRICLLACCQQPEFRIEPPFRH